MSLENDIGVFNSDGQKQKWVVLRSTWNTSYTMFHVLKHYLTFANSGHHLEEDKESDAENDTEDEGNPEERQKKKSNKKRWRGGPIGPSGS